MTSLTILLLVTSTMIFDYLPMVQSKRSFFSPLLIKARKSTVTTHTMGFINVPPKVKYNVRSIKEFYPCTTFACKFNGRRRSSSRLGVECLVPGNIDAGYRLMNHMRGYTSCSNPTLCKNNREKIKSTSETKLQMVIKDANADLHEVEAEGTRTPNDDDDGKGIEDIIQLVKDAYEKSDTDGILSIASKLHSFDLTGDEIISMSLDAASQNKGKAAGIINAHIASCRNHHGYNEDVKPNIAWDTYISWEEQADEIGLYPDLVTFCATYSVMVDAIKHSPDDKEFYKECAVQVLERAERYTKKIAGSKRRKLLAALSRKKKETSNVMASDHEHELKYNYGEDFAILFENDDCLVVSKPSGMVCFHNRKTTDGKIKKKKSRSKKKQDQRSLDDDEVKADISLEDALIDIGVSLSTLNPDALGIVHRIDRGTSGCIILAKNNDSHARLVTNFFTRCANKHYMALLPYKSTVEDHNGIDALEPVGTLSNEIGGKSALSHYELVQTYGTDAILVKVTTKTGRKHQVRIHCKEGLGRPIILDPLFSTTSDQPNKRKREPKKKKASSEGAKCLLHDSSNDAFQTVLEAARSKNEHRFFLHASSLEINEFGVNVSNDIPLWWNDVLAKTR